MTNRKTRQNPLATARDLVDVTVVDAGDGEAQFVIGGVEGPTFTPTAAVWSGITGKPAVIAAGATKAEALEAVDIPTVFAESFRDGVRTDNEILEAAFDAAVAGGEVVLGHNVTYTLTSTLTVDLTDKPGLTINGQGATLYGEGATVDGPLFAPEGTAFDIGDRPEVTADISERTSTITVDDSSAIQPGDLVSIYSDAELFDSVTGEGAEVKQELSRVASVPDSTTVVLESRTWDTYSTDGYTVMMAHYRPMRDITIKDLTLRGDRDDLSRGLRASNFDGLTLVNVRAYEFPRYGLLSFGGFNLVGIGCHAGDCSLGAVADYNGTMNGYGLWSILVHGVKWIGCHGRRNRHTVDAHRTRDLLVQGCTIEGDLSAGISTHGVDMAKIVDCTVRECGGGITVRGTNNVIRGNHVIGVITDDDAGGQSYVNGINIGLGSSPGSGFGGRVAHNLIIDGNYVDISGPDYVMSDTGGEAIRINGPANNARITGNILKGFPRSGIIFRGAGNTDVEVTHNRIDVSGQQNLSDGSVNREAISFNSTSSDAAVINTDIVVADNVVISGVPNLIVLMQGGGNSSHRSDRISIRNNFAASCTSASVSFGGGFYGTQVEVHDLHSPPGQTVANFTAANFLAPPTITDLSTATALGRTGANLASNPQISNLGFFAGDGVYTTDQAYFGTRSVRLTATGAARTYTVTADRSSEYRVVVQPGEVYYMEAFVYGKSTNVQVSGGEIRFQAFVERIGTSATTANVDFTASTALNGAWTKLSGYVTMPSLATLASFRIVLRDNVTADEVYYFDNIAVYRCGDQLQVAVPAAADSAGVTGQWAADSSYYYRCTATNTWRRVAIDTW